MVIFYDLINCAQSSRLWQVYTSIYYQCFLPSAYASSSHRSSSLCSEEEYPLRKCQRVLYVSFSWLALGPCTSVLSLYVPASRDTRQTRSLSLMFLIAGLVSSYFLLFLPGTFSKTSTKKEIHFFQTGIRWGLNRNLSQKEPAFFAI